MLFGEVLDLLYYLLVLLCVCGLLLDDVWVVLEKCYC